MGLDVTSGTPLYRQMRQDLFSRIRRGDFGPQAMLPSENELCREYQVSVTTARRALLELVKEGVVKRRAGVGTMVAPQIRQAHLAFVSIDYAGDAWRENSAAMGELVAGIGELAWRRDASFSMSGVDEDRAEEYLRSLVDARSVDGVLLRTPNEVHPGHVDILEAGGIPYVVIKRELPSRQLNCVVSDDVRGARLATEHLLGRGHRRIGFVCAKPALTLTQHRLAGYRMALEAAGIEFDGQLVRLESSFGETIGYRAVRELLEIPLPPTAVFAASDTMAMGGYRAARSLGLAIADDVALVGYDDIGPAAVLEPPLTTVRTSYHEFGSLAAELLLDLIDGRVEAPQRRLIEPQLIVRESTGPVPRKPRRASPSGSESGGLQGRRLLVGGAATDLADLVGASITDADGAITNDVGRSLDEDGFDAAVWAVDLRRDLDRALAEAQAGADLAGGRLAEHRRAALVLVARVPEPADGAGMAAAAAAGLAGLTGSLARSWSGRGVRVNAVGITGRGDGRQALESCLFLLSDASESLTGQVLRVGGGG